MSKVKSKQTATANFVKLDLQNGMAFLRLCGRFRLENLGEIERELEDIAWSNIKRELGLVVDAAELKDLDTASWFALLQFLRRLEFSYSGLQFSNFRDEHQGVVNIVKERSPRKDGIPPKKQYSFLQVMGYAVCLFLKHARDTVSFLGATASEITKTLLRPRQIRLKELFVQLETVCFDAIPVVSLVTFLIGVVVAYLFAEQLQRYGANVFIVDGIALAMCRELSPIIVAIIVAGRSGSAFTAQIGTMRLNEEIDAMTTLGLSPMRVLVIPRVLGLIIAMPLLVFVGDIMGILGGMFIAMEQLNVTQATFTERLQIVLTVKSFLVGLGKAPVFALFIALIGCRMGLNVERNTRSVGLHTTSTVVQSIVAVILLNAAFAVIFVELGI